MPHPRLVMHLVKESPTHYEAIGKLMRFPGAEWEEVARHTYHNVQIARDEWRRVGTITAERYGVAPRDVEYVHGMSEAAKLGTRLTLSERAVRMNARSAKPPSSPEARAHRRGPSGRPTESDLLGPGLTTFTEAKEHLKVAGPHHTIITDTFTGLMYVVRNRDLSKIGSNSPDEPGRYVQEPERWGR